MRTTSATNRRTQRVRSAVAGLCLAAAPWIVTGCDDEYIVSGNCPPPVPPVDVYSVTGDREVTVYWTPTGSETEREFVIYRAPNPGGTYREIGHTRRDYYVDTGVANGVTYFYAITAVDDCGYESDLSRGIAQDTPRPEGRATLRDANGPDWRRGGWDFSGYQAVPWDAPAADLIFTVSDGVPFLIAADYDTDIQDAGYVGFDGVDWAPDGGWNPSGAVEAVRGHCYVVWTRDNHYAKVRILSVDGGAVEFDWAYQIDGGNPELKPRMRESGPGGLLSRKVS